MRVYRLSKRKYANALSGKGAALSGNRWNSKGTEIVYTAESRSLAMAEVVVHLTLATLPSDYVMMEIDVPDTIKIKVLDIAKLDFPWNVHPPHKQSQKIGDRFIASMQACVLKVPSVVVQRDFNYLLNPFHSDFKDIKIVNVSDFLFDKRIF